MEPHEKTLRSAIGEGAPIEIKEAQDEEDEAQLVVCRIKAAVAAGKGHYGEHAILFRTQVQPRVFEMRLRADRIPYILLGGMSFFDRK